MKINSTTLLALSALTIFGCSHLGSHSASALHQHQVALAKESTKLGDGPTDKQIEKLRGVIEKHPDHIDSMEKLGLAYMQKGRETGELDWYVLGRDTLTKAQKLDPKNGSILGNLALCMTIFHNFGEATSLAKEAVKLDSRDHRALGVLTDSYLELGRYEEALDACQKMIDIKPDLASYSRAARLRFIYGDNKGAGLLMEKAVQCGSQYSENTAWCRTMLAEMYWKSGATAAAEQQVKLALEKFPNYRHAQMMKGRIDLARGKTQEAVALMESATKGQAPIPYLSELQDAYELIGDAEKAKSIAKRVDETVSDYHKRTIGGEEPQVAMYELEHGGNIQKALELCEAEVKEHTSVDVYATLAWAYFKHNRIPEAQEAMKSALRTNIQDPMLFYRAGKIDQAAGELTNARKNFQKALSLNSQFHPVYAKEASQNLVVRR